MRCRGAAIGVHVTQLTVLVIHCGATSEAAHGMELQSPKVVFGADMGQLPLGKFET
jgi:hypothetical protein